MAAGCASRCFSPPLLGCAIALATLAGGSVVPAEDAVSARTVLRLIQDAHLGRAEPSLAVTASALTADILLPVATDPGFEQRWYRILSDAIAALPSAQGLALRSSWSQRIAWLLDHADADERERLAAACLPDPAAVAIIAQAAARCADQGESARSLAIDLELQHCGCLSVDAWRRDRFLSGLWPGAAADAVDDLILGLPRPGPALPGAEPPAANAWQITATQVAWVDPWGVIGWRRTFAAPMSAVPCASGVAVRDPTGIHLLRPDGSLAASVARDDAPTILASAAGVLIGTQDPGQGWQCLGWRDGRAQALTLPAPSLRAPVVEGPFTAWLTRDEVLIYRGAHRVARIRHAAAVDGRWCLSWSGLGVVLRAPDGSGTLFPLLPATTALADGSALGAGLIEPLARPLRASRTLEWFLRTDQGDRALAWWRAHPDLAVTPWQRRGLLTTVLAAGIPEPLRAPGQGLLCGVEDLQAAWWYTLMQTRPGTAALAFQARQALVHLLRTPDQEWFPMDHAWYGESAQAWPQAWSGVAVRLRLERRATPWPQTLDVRTPVRLGSAWDCLTDEDPATWQVTVQGSDTTTDVTARGADGRPRWHHRWTAPFLHSAAARTHAWHDGWLLITEGDARLCVLDPGDGTRCATIADPDDDLDASLVIVRSEPRDGRVALAVLGPPGLCTQLTLIDAAGGRRQVQLPEAARWQVRAPQGAVLVMGRSGQATLVDASGHSTTCAVPPALAASAQASASAQGIRAGMAWLPWNAGSP